jgi:hypothetical protein
VANGTLAAEWAIAAQYEAILNQYSDLTGSFVGTYEGMGWGYLSGGIGGTSHTSYLGTKDTRAVIVANNIPITGTGPSYESAFFTMSAGSPIHLVKQATWSGDTPSWCNWSAGMELSPTTRPLTSP